MRYEKPMNIKTLLEKSSLAQIMRKGLFLNTLNQRLQQIFPAQYQGLYQVADMDQEALTLQVANASVRQALLFRQQALLNLVNQDYPSIKQLKFCINPQLARQPK